MNKNISLIAAVAAAAMVPALASAQSSGVTGYGSLGYSHHSMDDVDVGAIQGRLGARFNPYLGVEGELGFGVKKDDVGVAGVDAKVELQNSAAIYGVGFLPVAPNADLYARVGYGKSEVKVSAPGVVAKGDGNSWNYGVGGQYFFDDNNGVRADYTRHDFEDDAGEADVWSLGYVRKF
ncbi:porin family protein [Phenylobacterium sp.]|uniref:porin family protein n=1 Tax=Phenylobacterium sp. TaxID=1871053 RepID=UPI00289D757F|nr:porin family protein [Phenylobacterium sp.]